jgi:uncharacterized protein
MKIWIDADASPREVKEIVFKVSKRLGISIVLVANQKLAIPKSALIELVTVSSGANMADRFLIEHANQGDIVITADIPLAASLVDKRILVIEPRGSIIDQSNAANRLAARDFFDEARGAGAILPGPKPYSTSDRIAFANALDRTVAKLKKTIRASS